MSRSLRTPSRPPCSLFCGRRSRNTERTRTRTLYRLRRATRWKSACSMHCTRSARPRLLSLRLRVATVVLYFTPRGAKETGHFIYMGRDKVENEELIAHGLPEDGTPPLWCCLCRGLTTPRARSLVPRGQPVFSARVLAAFARADDSGRRQRGAHARGARHGHRCAVSPHAARRHARRSSRTVVSW